MNRERRVQEKKEILYTYIILPCPFQQQTCPVTNLTSPIMQLDNTVIQKAQSWNTLAIKLNTLLIGSDASVIEHPYYLTPIPSN